MSLLLFFTGSSGSNGTATPTAVALAAVVPAPTSNTGGALTTPAAVALAVVAPAPTSVKGSALIIPTAVTLTTTVPAPTAVSGSALNIPAAITRTVVAPAPTSVTGTALTTPAAVALPAVAPAPVGSVSIVTAPSAVALADVVPAPTAMGASSTSPAAVAMLVVVPDPLAGTIITTSPSAVTLAVVAPAPATSGGGSASPSAITLSASVPAPTSVSAGSQTNPGAITLSAVVPAPTTTTGGARAPPTTVALTTTVSTPTSVTGGALTTPAAISRTVVVPAPTAVIQTLPAAVTLPVTAPAPTVSGGALTTPAAVTRTPVLPAPSTSGGATPLPSAVALSAVVPAPTLVVTGNGTATPSAVALSAVAPAATGSVPATTTPAAVGLSASTSVASYVTLHGVSTEVVSTPHAAAQNVAGNLELIVHVAMDDWTPAAVNTLWSKYGATVADASWRILLNTGGTLTLAWTVDGVNVSNAVNTIAPTIADGAGLWIRIQRTSSNGSTDFHTAPDQRGIPTSWTTLQLNRTSTGGVLFASTAELEVGGHPGGSTGAAGKFYRAIERSGFGGTTVADFNPDESNGQLVWTDSLGEVWTVQPSGTLVHGGPTVRGGGTATPAAIALSVVAAAPSASGTSPALAAPPTIACLATAPAPTVTGTATSSPAAVALAVVAVDPTASGSSFSATATPAAIALSTVLSVSSYVQFHGVSGEYASTPHSPTLNVPGNIEILLRVALTDWTPATIPTLLSKWGASVANGSWRVDVNTVGTEKMTITVDGIAVDNTNETVVPPFTDGQTYWIRVTRTSSTGNVSFYYAADSPIIPTVWTTLQLNRATNAGVLFGSTADINVGGNNDGSANLANGKFYRAIIKNGIGGTVVADFTPDDSNGQFVWVGTAGNVWTVHGPGTTLVHGSTRVTGGATPTPPVVALAASVPAPTASGTSGSGPGVASPSAIGLSVSAPAPTVNGGSNATPASVARSVVVPPPIMTTTNYFLQEDGTFRFLLEGGSWLLLEGVGAGSGTSGTAQPIAFTIATTLPAPTLINISAATPTSVAIAVNLLTGIGETDHIRWESDDMVLMEDDMMLLQESSGAAVGSAQYVLGDANVFPTTAAPTVAVPDPHMGTNATVTPAAIGLSAVAPAPTASAGATTAPAAVPLTTTAPQPVADASFIAFPSAVALTTVLPAPTVRTDSQISPASIGLFSVMPPATASGGSKPQPGAVALSVVAPAPTIFATVSGTATPAAIVRVVTTFTPQQVVTNGEAFPDDVALNAVAIEPNTFASVAVHPSAIARAVTAQTPSVFAGHGAIATPSAIVRDVLLPAPVGSTTGTAHPAAIAIVFFLPNLNRALPAAIVLHVVVPMPTIRISYHHRHDPVTGHGTQGRVKVIGTTVKSRVSGHGTQGRANQEPVPT